MSEAAGRLLVVDDDENNRNGLLKFNRSRTFQIVLLTLGCVFFVYASIRVVHHQARLPLGDGDWGVYFRAGRAMRLRQPIYTLEYGIALTFKNAPVVALLIAPLTVLPLWLARCLWLAGEIICNIVMFRMAGRIIMGQRVSTELRGWIMAAAALFVFHYLLDEWFSGTNAAFYLLASVAAFVWAWEGRGGRAGITLGLAICLKLVPIVFIPWLLCCRRPWKSVASLILTLLVLALLPALWIGPQRNLELLGQWPTHLAHTQNHVQDERTKNQSVYSAMMRLMTDTDYNVQVVTLPPQTVRHIWLAISFLTAAMMYGWIYLRMAQRRPDVGASLSLLLIYMTIFNPLAWRYTYVALGIPWMYILWRLCQGVKHPRIVIALLVGAYFPHFASDRLQALDARLISVLFLTAAASLCIQRIQTNSPVAVATSDNL